MKRFLIRFICLFVPFKRPRRALRKRLKALRFCPFPSLYPYRLYYFDSCPNFGDLLALDLMRYFNVRFCVPTETKANIMCVGSLFDGFLTIKDGIETRHPLHVWGTGFMYAPSETEEERFCRPLVIHAVRGKNSQKRLERIFNRSFNDIALGDPGLLIRRMFPDVSADKKYDVGIVCHMVDKESPGLANIRLEGLTYRFIDIQQPTGEFIKQLAECRFVLSSAMHGLICADSLNIPNRHIVLSDDVGGGDYKFKDYYSVFNCPYPEPIDMRQAVIRDDDIARLTRDYRITAEEVERICDDLEKSFPRDLKKG